MMTSDYKSELIDPEEFKKLMQEEIESGMGEKDIMNVITIEKDLFKIQFDDDGVEVTTTYKRVLKK